MTKDNTILTFNYIVGSDKPRLIPTLTNCAHCGREIYIQLNNDFLKPICESCFKGGC